MKFSRSMLIGAGLLALSYVSASAQEVIAVPGSPGVTTTIDGKQLPPPDPKFDGVIKEKASESTAWGHLPVPGQSGLELGDSDGR
jgi:hypothetical protein